MSKKSGDLVGNKKAFHDYEILDTFEAGIVLQGTEIKSLREKGGSLQEAYIRVQRGELWLIGCNIPQYTFGNIHNHEEKRARKLLMHKREIQQLKKLSDEKGIAIIPLGICLKKGRAKLRLGTARGKKQFDKRQTIKERDEKRRIDRVMKEH